MGSTAVERRAGPEAVKGCERSGLPRQPVRSPWPTKSTALELDAVPAQERPRMMHVLLVVARRGRHDPDAEERVSHGQA